MLQELKELKATDILGGTLLTAFMLGWINLGQGVEYTWYNVIYILGNL